MSAPNPATRALYNRLSEVLGDEHADTLMTYLPPQPSTDLATRSDIADLRAEIVDLGERIEHRFERLDDRIDDLHRLMWQQMRNYSVVTVSAMTALTAIFGIIFALVVS